MDKRHCRDAVKARSRSHMQVVPMGKPENKPDLAVEDAERPKEGAGTKTAELVKAAVSKALLARAAEQAARRSKSMAQGLEDLGSRAVVPRDVRSSMGQEIAKLQRQSHVFGGGVMPKATATKKTRETIKSIGPRTSAADTEAAQMAGSYGDSVRAMNAKMDANLASRAQVTNSGRMAPASIANDATLSGVAPPPLPGTNVVTPSRPVVPVTATDPTRARSVIPVQEATAPGIAPMPLQQTSGRPRPMTPGRATLLTGSQSLASSMMNRPVQQAAAGAI